MASGAFRTCRSELISAIDSPPVVVLQWICAGVAQLAEQLFCKQQVVGSIPTTGSTIGEA